MRFDPNKIIKKISNYEVVSFDIFDTLIKRNVSNPTDVFKMVQIIYEKTYNKKIKYFEKNRILAEKKAREKSSKQDVSYDNIYDEILNITNYDQKVVNKLKQIELQVELQVCEKNIDIYPIYKYCVNKNKKIIIISDMYLNKNFLEKILKKNQIDIYDKLYVSSDTGFLKSKGDMFKFVLENLKIGSKEIIHIGDAKRGDFLIPKVLGISSVLIPKKINHLKFYNNKFLENNEKFEYGILSTFINNRLGNYQFHETENFCIGYEILGPLLYAFCRWLIDKCKKAKVENIYFLSREGNLIKKAFDIIKQDGVKSTYIYVSRRSLTVPVLRNIYNKNDLFKTITIKREANIESLFKSCGLNYKDYESYIRRFDYNRFTYISDACRKKQKFDEFLNGILEDIKLNARKEYHNLIGYLNQFNFDKEINIVDIGWKGSMQNALLNIFKKENKELKIKGYYIGLKSDSSEFIVNGMKGEGFLFNNSINMENEFKIMSFVGLCEVLFQAQHGSTIKYEFKNNKYIPVLDKYEFNKSDKNFIMELQKGALKFVSDYSEWNNSDLFNFTSNVMINNLVRLGIEPSLKEIEKFGNINFLDGDIDKLVNNKNFLYYLFNLRKLKADFLNCSWKIAFFKKLFKVNINYFGIYKKLKKIDKR